MKWQKIKYTKKGVAYVTCNGKRINLGEFIKTHSPWGQSGDDFIMHKGKQIEVHGWYPIGYYGAYGLHLSDCGTMSKVFYKQNF